jgi:hypothetical protein
MSRSSGKERRCKRRKVSSTLTRDSNVPEAQQDERPVSTWQVQSSTLCGNAKVTQLDGRALVSEASGAGSTPAVTATRG